MVDRRSTFFGGLSASALFAALAMSQGCSDESAEDGNADASADASPEARSDARSDGGAPGSGSGADGSDAGLARDASEGGSSSDSGVSMIAPDASSADRAPLEPDGSDEASQDDASSPVDPGDANPYLVPTCQPTPVTSALVTDFTYAAGSVSQSQVLWGNWYSNFSGYSYYYPTAENGGLLTSDVTSSQWRIAGVVSDYAGFGLGFACKTDASRYAGVSFTIRGTLGGPLPPSDGGTDGGSESGSEAGSDAGREAGPRDAATDATDAREGAPGDAATALPIRLTFGISSAPTDVASVVTPSWGTCIPRTGNQYDGTCVTPSTTIDLTPTGRTYRIRWADLTGGAPRAVDPTQLTRIFWTLTWNGAATPRYAVDVTIDDVMFIDDADAASPADAAAAAQVDAQRDSATTEAAARD